MCTRHAKEGIANLVLKKEEIMLPSRQQPACGEMAEFCARFGRKRSGWASTATRGAATSVATTNGRTGRQKAMGFCAGHTKRSMVSLRFFRFKHIDDANWINKSGYAYTLYEVLVGAAVFEQSSQKPSRVNRHPSFLGRRVVRWRAAEAGNTRSTTRTM